MPLLYFVCAKVLSYTVFLQDILVHGISPRYIALYFLLSSSTFYFKISTFKLKYTTRSWAYVAYNFIMQIYVGTIYLTIKEKQRKKDSSSKFCLRYYQFSYWLHISIFCNSLISFAPFHEKNVPHLISLDCLTVCPSVTQVTSSSKASTEKLIWKLNLLCRFESCD